MGVNGGGRRCCVGTTSGTTGPGARRAPTRPANIFAPPDARFPAVRGGGTGFRARAARRLCSPRGVRLESNVNLLVAALDLKLVRLVRAAMNAADGASRHGPGS